MEAKKEMSLATKLVTLRKQKGLTQMELAEKLNVSRQAISRWEVGAAVPSTDNLKVLSDLYGVSVDDILKGEVASLSQNPNFSEAPVDIPNNCVKIGLSKRLFACAFILLILIVAIVIGIIKFDEREENTYSPMKSMTTEEDEGGMETFSFD